MVTIRCTVYNHEPYIRECLEGFVMQKTNFRFEAIVHDDASTDGSAAIIREYAEKYPDIIKPIYQTENQYSKRDGSLRRILNEHMHGKYIAMCEGDDYWIDPLKLQKQVDFLEANSNVSLCIHGNYINENGRLNISKRNNYKEYLSVGDIILKGSNVATNSFVYRSQYVVDRPEWMNKFKVGDYPLILLLGTKGTVRFFNEPMSVYRISSTGSWSEKMKNSSTLRKENSNATIKGLLVFDKYYDRKYTLWVHYKLFTVLLKQFLDYFSLMKFPRLLYHKVKGL